MSLSKRFMQLEQERDDLLLALEVLIEQGELQHDASIGVAKKIIGDGTVDSLSSAQMDVFKRFIAPKLKIECEECGTSIHLGSYPEVIANAEFEGKVLCDGCFYCKQQMRKDD